MNPNPTPPAMSEQPTINLQYVWDTDAPSGYAWECPDCGSQATLGGNAGFHVNKTLHKLPVLVPFATQPPPQPVAEELPPCPFCGSAADIEEHHAFCDNPKCGLYGQGLIIDKWNRRATLRPSPLATEGELSTAQSTIMKLSSALATITDKLADAENDFEKLRYEVGHACALMQRGTNLVEAVKATMDTIRAHQNSEIDRNK